MQGELLYTRSCRDHARCVLINSRILLDSSCQRLVELHSLYSIWLPRIRVLPVLAIRRQHSSLKMTWKEAWSEEFGGAVGVIGDAYWRRL
jgi:hypothetical protein